MKRTISIGMGMMALPFADAAGYWRWVDLCEQGGVDSIWQSDRLITREPVLECLSVMAALAGRTRRLKFGMNVLSLALRDPVLVAKQCATIDYLSEGRLLPAFGLGSPRGAEWEALGIDTKTRGARMDEALTVMSRLWREDGVDFDGRFFKLAGASISPKPVQKDIPLWIGGASDAAIRRTAKFGTGWQAGAEPLDEIARVILAIRAALEVEGRHIDIDHYGAGLTFHIGSPDDPGLAEAFGRYEKLTGRDPRAMLTIGSAEDIIARIEQFIDAGVSKFVLRPALAGEEAMVAQTRLLVEQVIPRVSGRRAAK